MIEQRPAREVDWNPPTGAGRVLSERVRTFPLESASLGAPRSRYGHLTVALACPRRAPSRQADSPSPMPRLVQRALRAVIYRSARWWSEWRHYSREYDMLAEAQRRQREAEQRMTLEAQRQIRILGDDL